MKKLKFDELSLSSELLQAVSEMGFVEASPIQSQAIPFLLQGRDVIGQAQTGTGKTAAFSIPALETLDTSSRDTQVLVLCPTRELALQVCEEVKKLSKYKRGVITHAIYGGDPIDRQIRALNKGVQIVVGTPGRVIDHIERGTLDLSKVKMIILDEADEMLDMGFREDIEMVLDEMPQEKQTVFFSATMAQPIMNLTKKYQVNPEIIKITKNELTTSNIEQAYFEVKSNLKMEAMRRLMEYHNLQLMLVFCNTKAKVDEVVEELQMGGYQAEGLHGDMNQSQRNRVMGKFRNGNVNILVATDVAARGIDVNGVDGVFNYDLPLDPEYYVHRIGRTGRAGKDGKSFTFVSGRERGKLRDLQNYIKAKIEQQEVPTGKELEAIRKIKFVEKVKETILENEAFNHIELAQELENQGHSKDEIISALLSLSLGKDQKTYEEISFRDADRKSSRTSDRFGEKRDRFSDRKGRSFERGSSSERKPRLANGKMARLFINLGKKSKIRPGDIVGAISGETGISGDTIGSIDIYDKFSFVEVPKSHAEKIIEIMNNNQIKGLRVNMEIAKAPSYA
jgi:ATP-dependent RNA helicase DeaD